MEKLLHISFLPTSSSSSKHAHTALTLFLYVTASVPHKMFLEKWCARFSLLFTFLLWYRGQRFRGIIISFHLFHFGGYFEIKNHISLEYLNICIPMVSAFYIVLGCALFLILFPNFWVILESVMDITVRVYVKSKHNLYRYSTEFWSIVNCEKHFLKYLGKTIINFQLCFTFIIQVLPIPNAYPWISWSWLWANIRREQK